jgi:hypothetical protein
MFEIGSTPAAWRPATGADSVPFPDACWGEGPAADAAWARYWRDCAEAERRETADQAIVRCRAEADSWKGGAARFDHVLAELLRTFDYHERELAGPDAEAQRGMSLEMISVIVNVSLEQMASARHELDKGFDEVNRERYRKAAATFAKIVADLAIGMNASAAATAGGAA